MTNVIWKMGNETHSELECRQEAHAYGQRDARDDVAFNGEDRSQDIIHQAGTGIIEIAAGERGLSPKRPRPSHAGDGREKERVEIADAGRRQSGPFECPRERGFGVSAAVMADYVLPAP